MIKSYWKRDLPDSYRLIALLLIIVVGFSIRLHDLDHDSLWLDEILAVESTRKGFDGIWNHRDHPPLFYAAEVAAVNTFNESEFAAESPR